ALVNPLGSMRTLTRKSAGCRPAWSSPALALASGRFGTSTTTMRWRSLEPFTGTCSQPTPRAEHSARRTVRSMEERWGLRDQWLKLGQRLYCTGAESGSRGTGLRRADYHTCE